MNELLQSIADQHGTPCYVYFMDQVFERAAALRQAFGGRFALSFAVKSNPNIELLRRLRGHVDGLDISSAGELDRALGAGWPAETLSFTGPGKRPCELDAAVEQRLGEVIVESLAEAQQLSAAAGAAGVRQAILVRIGPKRVPRGFGVSMSGKPTQFGVDEEELDAALTEIRRLPHLDLAGFHIYSGTQCLNPDSVAENYEIFLDLFRRTAATHNVLPRKLVFGSGLGIPYHEQDKPLDLAPIAQRINPQLDALKAEPRFAHAKLVLELGRYLVGEAGIYLTRVIGHKRSRGVDICICDGGMNHHLGACGHFGSVIHRNYRIFKVPRIHPRIHPSGADESADAPVIPHELVGPLCTTIDTLGHSVKLPALKVGDVIGIRCSGAYGLSASPINFISHAPAREIAVETRNGAVVVDDISQSAIPV